MSDAPRSTPPSARPRTVQEAIARFEAQGRPAHAALIRLADDPQTFAVLVDRLPHAIEAGEAAQAIALLKLWGAWRGLYPVDKAAQALLIHGSGPADGGP